MRRTFQLFANNIQFTTKYSKMVKIGTHSGTFHCDEALACFMLKQLPEYADAEIIRTRDKKILEDLDIVVDVGGIYDHEKKRYDHHQIGFDKTYDEIKLSSAGLIFTHYGKEIIKKIGNLTDEETETVFERVYQDLIKSIDAIDNGVDQFPSMSEVEVAYSIKTDLSSRVGRLNPSWQDNNADFDQLFKKAVEITGEEFLSFVNFYSNEWMKARKILEKSIEKRFEIHETGEIVLMETSCPWKDHLFSIEQEHNISGQIKYVVFLDSSGAAVQCVPLSKSSFENRLSLPWKGLRDEELSKESGIEGGIFVHISGFIGGNSSKEGAIEMAKKALLQNK